MSKHRTPATPAICGPRIILVEVPISPVSGLFVPEHFCSRERKVHRENFRSSRTNFPITFAPNVKKHSKTLTNVTVLAAFKSYLQ